MAELCYITEFGIFYELSAHILMFAHRLEELGRLGRLFNVYKLWLRHKDQKQGV